MILKKHVRQQQPPCSKRNVIKMHHIKGQKVRAHVWFTKTTTVISIMLFIPEAKRRLKGLNENVKANYGYQEQKKDTEQY